VGPWLASLALFGAFAAVSLYLGWIGQTSCGCTGTLLSVSPWFAFGFDVFMLAILGLARPQWDAFRNSSRAEFATAVQPAVYAMGAVLVFSGLLFGTIYLTFGSVPAAAAFVRGDRISIRPGLVDLGAATAGEGREIEIEVCNWSDEPMRVIGGTSDCSCTVLQDLPLEIPAHESRTVTVAVRSGDRPGIFTRTAALLVDDRGTKRIGFRITGRIAEGASH
jgi:hypothetical protein